MLQLDQEKSKDGVPSQDVVSVAERIHQWGDDGVPDLVEGVAVVTEDLLEPLFRQKAGQQHLVGEGGEVVAGVGWLAQIRNGLGAQVWGVEVAGLPEGEGNHPYQLLERLKPLPVAIPPCQRVGVWCTSGAVRWRVEGAWHV